MEVRTREGRGIGSVRGVALLEKISPLLEKGAEVLKESIESGESILVIAHYDADGLSAASIFARLLEERGTSFHLAFVEQVYPEVLADFPLSEYDRVVLLDLGSGYKEHLRSALGSRATPVLIVDHHPPSADPALKCVEVNPYLAGVDASALSSASVVTYLLARRISPATQELVCAAVAGALGDRLDNGEKFSLTGLNAEVVEEAKKLGFIEEKVGLRLFGSKQRPIVSALAATMDPYIPGISGSESAAYEFLRRVGIEPKVNDELRTLGSLSRREEALLATELVKHMLLSGASVHEAQKVVGYNYYSVKEPPGSPLKDLRERAYLLNALGRMEQYSTGVALNLGYKDKFLVRAEDTLRAYRRVLAKFLARVEAEWHELAREGRTGTIIFLEDLSPKLTGSLCSIIAGVFAGKLRGKRLIGVAAKYSERKWKISFRRLADDINLGEYLRSLAVKVSGIGGGHPAAGGMLVDEKALEELLKEL